MKNAKCIVLLHAVLFLYACHPKKPDFSKLKIPEIHPDPSRDHYVDVSPIEWDYEVIDLKKIKRGSKYKCFFELTNKSSDWVLVPKITSSHKSISILYDYSILTPTNGSTQIGVLFDSSEESKSDTIPINIFVSIGRRSYVFENYILYEFEE